MNETLIRKFRAAKDLIPGQELAGALLALCEVGKEAMRARTELAKIHAARDVALAKICANHNLYCRALTLVFDERRALIEKYFEIIDRGLTANNQEVVTGGLEGLGRIVAESPVMNVKALAEVLEGDRKIVF